MRLIQTNHTKMRLYHDQGGQRQKRPSKTPDLNWLPEVREFVPPLRLDAPIWMREVRVNSGPVIPCGETHPYCELSIVLEGTGTEYIEGEEAYPSPGYLLLIGPGVPHWVRVDRYPIHALTVFFLPGILLELGPLGDGVVLLQRLTMRQTIHDRVLHLPPTLRGKVEICFEQMWAEFCSRSLGWEFRLRSLLADILVAVVRWEHKNRKSALADRRPADWQKLERAMAHIRRHFAEVIYAVNLARATGVSETRLKVLFKQALGIPWTKFLQGYRVRQAAAMLCLPGRNVTNIAMACGFEDLGHFIKVFRKFMGTQPSAYAGGAHPPGKRPRPRLVRSPPQKAKSPA
jgi:AraC-like DNA-binding protein/quercetin dioxygenase-like cupin family protein